MVRGATGGQIVLGLGAAVAFSLPAGAAGAPPSDPACLGLVGGSTGLLVAGGSIPSGDQLAGRPGGFGPVAGGAVAATLPTAVRLKTQRETFGDDFAFALRDGRMYVVRAEQGRALRGERWHALELPACLDGHVQEISADGHLLLAVGRQRQLYAHDIPAKDLSPERWTWRWGPYFWTGMGIRLFGDVRRWAASELTSQETFTDSSGHRRKPLGVATAYLLRGDQRRITYLDPWLPTDESREVCGPRRGTLPLAGLSGSGSTVFVVGRRGELYTRIYDFDVSGANTVFGDYSWQRGRPASDARWQLPGPAWVRQPAPPGVITDRIAISKTGSGSDDRVLRVEGRDSRGRDGYWEKPIASRRRGAWHFVATAARLGGRRLPLGGRAPRFAPNNRRYAGTIAGTPAEILDFNPECSPATLRVHVAGAPPLDLVLHSSDGLRQETRAHGLSDTPREYNGAIEVPAAALALPASDPRRAWVQAQLGGRPMTTAPIAVTTTRLRFLAQCWQLTLNGAQARADVPRVPPDLGAAFARLTEQQKDGRGPSPC
jgi:hypothetical protein